MKMADFREIQGSGQVIHPKKLKNRESLIRR
jgi:hypothetical protein